MMPFKIHGTKMVRLESKVLLICHKCIHNLDYPDDFFIKGSPCLLFFFLKLGNDFNNKRGLSPKFVIFSLRNVWLWLYLVI